MIDFTSRNVNPKGRRTGDCVVRALTTAMGVPYEQVMSELFDTAMRTGYSFTSKQCYERVLKDHGFVKHPQPKKTDGTKYRVGEIDALCFNGDLCDGAVISLANHLTATSSDGDGTPYIVDLWDCRTKTIGNYWTKEE